jgi:hypothetical protein
MSTWDAKLAKALKGVNNFGRRQKTVEHLPPVQDAVLLRAMAEESRGGFLFG